MFSSYGDVYVIGASDLPWTQTSPEDILSVTWHLAEIEADDSLGEIERDVSLLHLHEEEENVVKYRG